MRSCECVTNHALKRSQLGCEEHREIEAYDERILGSGGFVEAMTRDDTLRELKIAPLSLAELIQKVCVVTGVDAEMMRQYGKERSVARARAIFCCLAVRDYGYTGKEAGVPTGLGAAGVSIAVRRGDELVKRDPMLRERVVGCQT